MVGLIGGVGKIGSEKRRSVLLSSVLSVSVPPISPDFHLDASDESTITKTGANVSGWADKSANSRDVTGVNDPQFGSDARGNYIETNGTSNYLFNTSPFMHAAGECTIFIVADDISNGDRQILGESNNGNTVPLYQPVLTTVGNDNLRFQNRDDGQSMPGGINSFDLGGDFFDGSSSKLITVRDDGSTLDVFENGISGDDQAYTRGGATTLNRFVIGALVRTTVSNYAAMKIREVIIYERSLSDLEVAQVHNYLLQKWWTPVETFLLMGQSNADGVAEISNLSAALDTFYDSPNTDLHIYQKSSSFADDGAWWELDRDVSTPNQTTHQTIANGTTRHGVELPFGYYFDQRAPDDELWVIKAAMGNTAIEDNWKIINADTDGLWYWARVFVVEPALRQMRDQGKTPRTSPLMFWMQGEADTNNQTEAEAYDDRLQILVDRVIDDWPTLQGTRVVIGGLSTRYDTETWGPTVKTGQAAVASANTQVVLLATDGDNPGGAYPLKADNVHYTSGAFERMAQDIIDLYYTNPATSLSAPAAITDLSASAGNGSISATWSAPIANGLPITGYVVQYKLTTDSDYTTLTPSVGTATSANITGLTNGSDYDVRVQAVNAAGNGSFASDTATPSAFTPSGVSGYFFDMDASDESSITDTGGSVSAWADQSSNSYDLSTNTGNMTTGANTINSLNVIDSNGAVMRWLFSGVYGLTNAAHTIFMVGRLTSSPTGGVWLPYNFFGPGGARGQVFFNFQGTENIVYRFGSSPQNATISSPGLTTDAHILVADFNGTNAGIRFNGGARTASGSASAFTTSNNSALLGDGTLSNYQYGQIITYNAALSLSDINDIGEFLAAKWGTTWTTAT